MDVGEIDFRPDFSNEIRHAIAVSNTGQQPDGSGDNSLLALFVAIASHDYRETMRRLDETPDLATRSLRVGASRQDPEPYFLAEIHHYVYAGDTALHVAAAAHLPKLAESLVSARRRCACS